MKPQTQEEFFSKTQTDNLLRHRYINSCEYPVKVGDKPQYTGDRPMWDIDKELLYAELAKRPHRVRARDRRKKK